MNWDQVDTVLLDMDGTLLDLHYDNTLWQQLVPKRFSEKMGLSFEEAQSTLFRKMSELGGSLQFYCLDYWQEYTTLNIIEIHQELAPLIRYLPNAKSFLSSLRENQKQVILVTNAHRRSLYIKNRYSNIIGQCDSHISCHDYGIPKEKNEFWEVLQEKFKFDKARALFIDDNTKVLKAATAMGIKQIMTIKQPDSTKPDRQNLVYPALNDFSEIMPK